MNTIKIKEVRETGERRWSIVLIDQDDRAVIESTGLLSGLGAHAVAKVLKHKVCDHADGTPVDGQWQFELIRDTKFRLLGDENCSAIPEVAKDLLVDVEIKWDPPEADPACKEKQADRTPTRGIPGS